MTMVFSTACNDFIVMANDCAVVKDFADGHVEYETGRKFFACDGVGCVTMWGARDGNNLIKYLSSVSLNSDRHCVEDLVHFVNRYLIEEYEPHSDNIGDTGFHVGGFSRNGEPRLYHVFWNVASSAAAADNRGTYSLQHHHPSQDLRFLYNGRNDLVNAVLGALLREVNAGKHVRFPFTASGMLRFAHFSLRFGAELTPEVGPPFVFHILAPNRKVVMQRFDVLSPLNDADLVPILQSVGLRGGDAGSGGAGSGLSS